MRLDVTAAAEKRGEEETMAERDPNYDSAFR